ncbi:MAG: HD domain-containing protein [Mobilitalea sp.]
MNKRKPAILMPVKKRIYIIVSAIFIILVFFLLLLYQTRQNAHEDKIMINVFGKQRMYTQQISKTVNHLYLLMQNSSSQTILSTAEIEQEIIVTKQEMIEARDGFTGLLKEVHKDKVRIDGYRLHLNTNLLKSSVALTEIDKLWPDFASSINVLLNKGGQALEMEKAVAFINNNNQKLLQGCDNLLNELLENSLKKDRELQGVAFVLIGLLAIVIFISLYQLQRHLLLPLRQLYKGLDEIGLSDQSSDFGLPTRQKMIPIVEEINGVFKKINSLITLIENMNNNDSFMDTLRFISNTFSPFIPYNYIGIAIMSEDKKFLKASYGVSDGTVIGLPENIVGCTSSIDETSLGKVFDSEEARIINDLEEYCEGKPIKNYNRIVLDAGIKSSITLPLLVSGEPMGMIFFSSTEKNVYTEEHSKFLHTLANSIAISLNQNIFIGDIVYSSILALAKLAEARDEDTGKHLDRISTYSRAIAELLYENNLYTDEITLEFIDNIERFSPLHDIGKVGIRDSILLKPGKLTMEEHIEMKQHASFGEKVLRSAEENLQKKGRSLFQMGAEIAGAHHEKWDGTGYPYGKKGSEIPLCARIVAVADVFDALLSKRPYKEAYPLEMTMDILKDGRGKHFDPVIIDVVLQNRKKLEDIYHNFQNKQIA